jgi:uncharacterized protein YeaO (DUF488 family)
VTALDAFSLSPAKWNEIENRYEAALSKVNHDSKSLDQASQLVVELLRGMSDSEQGAFALGIVVGRSSR